MSEKRFSEWLQERPLEPPQGDLAARIILAAHSVEQVRRPTLGAWVKSLLATSWLPRPAYALATALCVGFLLGFVVPPMDAGTREQAYMYDGGDGL